MEDVADLAVSINAYRAVPDSERKYSPAEVASVEVVQRMMRVMDRVIAELGEPKTLRCDNGAEFTSRHFVGRCEEQGPHRFAAYSAGTTDADRLRREPSTGRLRDECLNANWFDNLNARRKIDLWRNEYNSERPHSSLGNRTPEE
jgi:putative transposase